jgi:hypothetical protein
MAVQQVFSCDDLRKKILSYVVNDVYKCKCCNHKCSPLDSVLYKQKNQRLYHNDLEGGFWCGGYIDDDELLERGYKDSELNIVYTGGWIHTYCLTNGEFNYFHKITDYLKWNATPFTKLKKNGRCSAIAEHLINLINDGNLLFKKHKNEKTQKQADYFEKLFYQLFVDEINKQTKLYKKELENADEKINNEIKKIKRKKAIDITRTIRPELFTNTIIKMYKNKIINFETFMKNMEDMKYQYKYHQHNLQIKN